MARLSKRARIASLVMALIVLAGCNPGGGGASQPAGSGPASVAPGGSSPAPVVPGY